MLGLCCFVVRIMDMVAVQRISASERRCRGLHQAESEGELAERPDQVRIARCGACVCRLRAIRQRLGAEQYLRYGGQYVGKRLAMAAQSSIIVVGSSMLIICGNSGIGGRS